MCGICGAVSFNEADPPVDARVLERMIAVQAQRGPDGAGEFIAGRVGLGHRRLSIIDLEGGRQPMFNEDESVVTVFNGEIYNHSELAARLAAMGHRFRTRSDTEVIVHAYEQFGDECVEHFRGMFAFAVWDRKSSRLLLARDRLGIKPLYYYAAGGLIVFASAIEALLQHPAVACELDPAALDLYLALRFVPGPGTMFKGIYKLQPGHILSADRNGIRIRRYWDIHYDEMSAPDREGDRECMEQFEALLEESVRLRLIADVPLGVLLSGGLDSSAIAALVSAMAGGRGVNTFSVGYETSGASGAAAAAASELDHARATAEHCGCMHHEYRVSAREFADAIPFMAAALEEPLADASCIPLYLVSRMAREHVTVVLSGEGADEILGGYALYRRLLRMEAARRRMGRLAAVADWAIPFAERLAGGRIRSGMQQFRFSPGRHYRGVNRAMPAAMRAALTGPERFLETERRLDDLFGGYGLRASRSASESGALNRMLYADAKVWLPEDLLLKADKMTMAASIELRVPFLDHRLVEFAASLPASMKIRNGEGKWLLRRAMAGRLPESILRRPKQGFPAPLQSWLRHELKEVVDDTLLAHDSACRRHFHSSAIDALVRRGRHGRLGGYEELWTLIVFEHWRRHFLQRPKSRADRGAIEIASGRLEPNLLGNPCHIKEVAQ